VVVSAHWETTGFRVTDALRPPLVYDYFCYPPDAYEITYPVAGDPFLASRICGLLTANGLFARTDPRGLDHAVFIPLKVLYPDADVPVVALSLDRSLDPGLHLRVGAALARLRIEDILIVGSGSSFHSRDPHESAAQAFDDWLDDAIRDGETRAERLVRWEQAPGARWAHPREEHLIPLMVASGAAGVLPGQRISLDYVGGSPISGFLFG
jgi:aromatic ring-opening dioxygenase catalytic subunit (LigB family)